MFKRLVELVRSGRRDAKEADVVFQRIVSGHERSIKAMALAILGCAHAAEDVTQEAFVRLWQAVHKGEIRENHAGWLRQVGLNLARDRRRLDGIRAHESLDDTPEDVLPVCQAASSEASEMYGSLRERLDGLPARQQEAFRLIAVEGMSSERAASIMGCSATTVRKHYQRARQKLAEAFRTLSEKKTG